MGTILRKVTCSALLAGCAAALFVSPVGAVSEYEPGYVPPYGQNPRPVLPFERDPYGDPGTSPGYPPTVVSVDLPSAPTDPGSRGANGSLSGGDETPGSEALGVTLTSPTGDGGSGTLRSPADGGGPGEPAKPAEGGVLGNTLSRTGADSLPLLRAALASLTLGSGLVVMRRRRRGAVPAD